MPAQTVGLVNAEAALLSIIWAGGCTPWKPRACLHSCSSEWYTRWPLAPAAQPATFPHAWKAPGLFLRLIRHKWAFHWHQSHGPAPSTFIYLLLPRLCARCQHHAVPHSPALKWARNGRQHQLLCHLTYRRAGERQGEGHYQKPLGYTDLLEVGCFL